MKYVKSLDGLRAVAVLFVMLFHFYYTLEVGWIGVQLFFVLSGYLITSILLETKGLGLSGYLKRFYWRRVLRIFPLYYLYILLVAGIYLLKGIPVNFPTTLPYLLTYTYNFVSLIEGFEIDLFFTHFWSLAIEEQFYLFWPLLIFFLNRKGIQWMLVIIILVAPIIRWQMGEYFLSQGLLAEETIGELIYRFTPAQFDSFAFGALIPVFHLNASNLKNRITYLFICILTLILLSINYNLLEGEFGLSSLGLPIGSMLNGQHIWSYSAIGVLSMLMIILFNVGDDWNKYWTKARMTLFENRIMVETGKVSYGIYVYHWLILAPYRNFIHPRIENIFISFLFYFLLVFLVAQLSFRLFEQPFLKLKNKKFNA